MAVKKNKLLKKAKNEVEYLTGNAAVRRMAELREKWDLEYAVSMDYAKKQGLEDGKKQGIKEGKEQGIKEGIQIGEKNNQIKTVKEMINQGLSIELIGKITHLTTEEINNIKKKI